MALLLVLPACGGTDHPELHIDVVRSSESVRVLVTEPGRPDAVSQQPFAHPGECDVTSDGWSCDGACPAEFLGTLSLEADGQQIAEWAYDWPWGSGVTEDLSADRDYVLVIEDLDGAEVEVPLPDVARPAPAIDDATWDGDDLDVTWHTTPAAASAVVELSGGFGGPRCHVAGDADVTTLQTSSGAADSASVFVRAFAAPSVVETAFGDVEVWTGDATSLDLSAARTP